MKRGRKPTLDWVSELTAAEAVELAALRAKEEELGVVKMQITTLRFRGTWRHRQKNKTA